jgi:hypothetical protein
MSIKSAVHTLTTLAILCSIAITVGCGGSSASVLGPAPVFASSAPVVASEGASYTYTLAASDPQGGTVTFSLQSAPAGAAISGNTISWTPTHAQARQPNTFSVLATTSHNGTAIQLFTVTPAGDIHGSYINTYWAANGPMHVPVDLSSFTSIAALVPDSTGALTTIAGQGSANGTFVIPKVPAGFYWLQIAPTELFWTNSSDFDRGTDVATRPSTTPTGTSGAPQLTANLNVTGLSPWTSSSTLQGVAPNVPAVISLYTGFTTYPPSPTLDLGATAFTGQVPAWVSRDIDASQGDSTYVLQFEPTTLIGDPPPFGSHPLFFPYTRSVSALGPLSLTANSTTTTLDIVGQFTGSNMSSMRAKVTATGFTQSVGNAPPLGFGASVAYVPVGDRLTSNSMAGTSVLSGGFPLASVAAVSSPTSDIDLGDIQYANPFPPSWTPVYSAYQASGPTFTFGSTKATFVGQTGYTTTTPPSATKPFDLPMSNIQNPLINGTSIFTATIVIAPVTLSWTPPTGSTPSGYRIFVHELGSFPCDPVPPTYSCLPSPVRFAGSLATTSTTLSVPPEIIEAGHQYLFWIEAVSDPKMNMLTAPFRGSWNQSISEVVSNMITVAGPGAAPQSTSADRMETQATTQNVQFFMVGPQGIKQVRTTPADNTAGVPK